MLISKTPFILGNLLIGIKRATLTNHYLRAEKLFTKIYLPKAFNDGSIVSVNQRTEFNLFVYLLKIIISFHFNITDQTEKPSQLAPLKQIRFNSVPNPG